MARADALAMSENFATEQELPLDFTRFLSGRLGMEPDGILAVLGEFLLGFEPSARPPAGALSTFASASFSEPS